jgi:hypothetical protein
MLANKIATEIKSAFLGFIGRYHTPRKYSVNLKMSQ